MVEVSHYSVVCQIFDLIRRKSESLTLVGHSFQLILLNLFEGFSVNGELMMDLMGQEIAFKGIDVNEPYVPAFSLGAGQHAKINFGQVKNPKKGIFILVFTIASFFDSR